MGHWLTTALDTYVLHSLRGNGYQWWSGPGSDLGMSTAIVVYLRRHNCHAHWCWRLAWHPVTDGHHFCRYHHPDHPKGNKRQGM